MKIICLLLSYVSLIGLNDTPINPNMMDSNTTFEHSYNDVCDVLDMGSIEHILSWDSNLITSTSDNNKDKWSACYLTHKDEKLMVRFSWKNSNLNDGKSLEQQFDNYTTEGINGVKYRVLSNASERHVIVAKSLSPKGFNIYMVRMHSNNQAEIQIELTSASDYGTKMDSMLESLLTAMH